MNAIAKVSLIVAPIVVIGTVVAVLSVRGSQYRSSPYESTDFGKAMWKARVEKIVTDPKGVKTHKTVWTDHLSYSNRDSADLSGRKYIRNHLGGLP